jgi:hypothetical protein
MDGDSPTRWMSTYNMLKVCIKYQKSLIEFSKMYGKDFNIQGTDWLKLQDLKTLLKVTKHANLIFEGSQTSPGEILPTIEKAVQTMRHKLTFLTKEGKECRDILVHSIKQRWKSEITGQVAKYASLLFNPTPPLLCLRFLLTCTILDPKMKGCPLKWWDINEGWSNLQKLVQEQVEPSQAATPKEKKPKSLIFKFMELEVQSTDQLGQYKKMEPSTEDIPAVQWWEAQRTKFPDICDIAQHHLSAAPASSAVERLFSVIKADTVNKPYLSQLWLIAYAWIQGRLHSCETFFFTSQKKWLAEVYFFYKSKKWLAEVYFFYKSKKVAGRSFFFHK